MRIRTFTRVSTGILIPLLVACTVAPLQQDQAVQLPAGDGLAAVTLDTLDPLDHVAIADAHGFTRLEIVSVPVGQHIYLFPVPVGEYCLTRFQFRQWTFTSKKGSEPTCFKVKAGALSYSGTLAPRVEGETIVNHQVQDPAGFRIMLQQQYPAVAREFPESATAP